MRARDALEMIYPLVLHLLDHLGSEADLEGRLRWVADRCRQALESGGDEIGEVS